MAGLGEYAGSMAAGFGQRLDYWRDEDKKTSKQQKDAVDAIYQFAKNNPFADQQDLENYAKKSGVTDWKNLLGPTGFGDLAAELKRKRGLEREEIDHTRKTRSRDDTKFKQWETDQSNKGDDRTQRLLDDKRTRQNAVTNQANTETLFKQGQDKHFTQLKLDEHKLFMEEMEERLGFQKFMAQPMSDQQMRSIAADAFQELSTKYPQMDFSDDRANYDYQSRLQKRAQTRQEKETNAAKFIEKAVADNANKYSQEGELDKLRDEVRKANGFEPEVKLITDQRAGQIISSASEAEALRSFEAQTDKRAKLHAQLKGRSLYWDDAAMQPGGAAWVEAQEALKTMGLDTEAKQELFLQAFNPTGQKQEAEARLLSDSAEKVSKLAEQYTTVEELKKGLGWHGYELSTQTNDWLDGQIKAKAQTRRTKREKYIVEETAREFGNVKNIYHNVMQGDTKQFDKWIAEINAAKAGQWGAISKEEILQAIHRNQLPALQAEVKARKTTLINDNDYADPKDLKSILKGEAKGQDLNEHQQELILSTIEHGFITDERSIPALAEYVKAYEILEDTSQPVNMYDQATQLMARIKNDPTSAVNIAQTLEDQKRIKAWRQVITAEGFMSDPDGHIAELGEDIDADMFSGIQTNLDNLVKQEDWSIGDQRRALTSLKQDNETLRQQIRAEEILLEMYGSGLTPEYYIQMQGHIENAQDKRISITQQIIEAERSIGEGQATVTAESGLSVDAASFDLDSFIADIQTKDDAIDEHRISLYSQGNTSPGNVDVGVQMAEKQIKKDKVLLQEIKSKIEAAGNPNVPLVEIIGEEGVQQLQQIRDRDYNAIIDQWAVYK